MEERQTELLPQVRTLVRHQPGGVTACKDWRVKNKRKTPCSVLLETSECHQYNYVGAAHASSVFLLLEGRTEELVGRVSAFSIAAMTKREVARLEKVL